MKPLMLIILDGWGIREEKTNNAVALARTPNMDFYTKSYASSVLGASGLDVGLPEGQMGNSEVGHLNIGAGRIVYQDFLRIDDAIKDNSFFKNKVLLGAVKKVKRQSDKKLHLMGLLGPGGVHSHSRHLFALLDLVKQHELSRDQVIIHCFLDGRDTPQKSALSFIQDLERKTEDVDLGVIATVMGRYYAMDRDRRWDRIQKAYEAMVNGKGKMASTAQQAVEDAYVRGETDEFVLPTVIDHGSSFNVNNDDSIIFFNFRPDRARQITRVFTDKNFKEFDRKLLDVYFVCMTKYDKTFDLPVVFPSFFPKCTFGGIISKTGLKQLRIAETEKYAHVTFFFNGGNEEPFVGEERCLIPSPKVATYDLKPEMSAYEVTEEAIRRIKSDKYDVIILNFANPDMVGHTGKLDVAIKACEVVDECVGRIVNVIKEMGGAVLITSDHGNAESMMDDEGKPHTFHTSNPVPFILMGVDVELKKKGILADIAPTMLDLLHVRKPDEMTGSTLIKK